ncbi:histidine kinase dimerization/phosphoacceptor domain-containing protein [Niabella sp. W65]|nr:histidine kinase dimerization/phosphoacceptor domain-containing protein [Niabella sp. W65]MCH7363955.1 histidine kinase dimerization/phosphoacceptor domain-containing protein [Niabella sp. W65]
MTDAVQNIVLIVYVALLLGLLVLAIAMHLLIGKQKVRAFKSQLEQANQKLEQETAKIRFEIQEEDLSKVSDEIHDNIGQVLSSIGLNLEAINNSSLGEHDQTILARSVSRINHVTDELRQMARRLNGARVEKKG